MYSFFNRFSLELLVFVLSFIILLCEWHKEYFTRLGLYWKNVQFTFCLQLFFLFTALTVSSLFVDVVFLQSIQQIHHPFFEAIVAFGGWLGRGCNLMVLITSCYFLTVLLRKNNWSQLVFGNLLSVVFTVTLCFIFKHMFLRARPYTHYSVHSFFNLEGLVHNKNAFQSFPSGDVAVVAGVAGFLFYAVKNPYARWTIFVLPFTTALSRMSLNRHWPSDTIFSIGLGFMTASFIWQYQRCLRNEGRKR